MTRFNPHKTGLAVGGFIVAGHTTWMLLILLGLAQPLVDFALTMHRMQIPVTVLPFDVSWAVTLVLISLIGGYLIGYAFATIWNKAHKA